MYKVLVNNKIKGERVMNNIKQCANDDKLDEIRTKIYELWVQTNDEDDPFCSQLRLADIMGFNASELRKWIKEKG